MSFDNKISISVTDEIRQLLLSDAKYFEKYKHNSIEPNPNDLISCILIGYFEQFIKEKELYGADIIPRIRSFSGNSVRMSYKPVAKASTEVSLLHEYVCKANGDSEGSIIRDMLISYLCKPLYERERIVFRDVYDKLSEFCKENRTIKLKLKNSNKLTDVLALEISVGQGEMFNYLLCQGIDETHRVKLYSFRLCRISDAVLSNEVIEKSRDIDKFLKLTKQYGSQYAINEEKEFLVYFSEKGFRQYQRRYNGRPQFSEKLDKYYVFRCSEEQLFQYLKRFYGDEAFVVQPQSLRNRLKFFHENALECYISNHKK